MAYRPIDPPQSDKKLSKTLFTHFIVGSWDKIVEIYEKDPDAHTTKITKSFDTALHLAVQGGKEEVVKSLVDLIVNSHHPDKWVEVLGSQNDRGDTPLHFAASMGNLPMCYVLANSSHELIGIRNDEAVTPLFVAASNGNKEAFLCLHSLIPEARRELAGLSYGRNNKDGNTILHCALQGDYLDLAFQIIHRYRDLGNRLNEDGNTPLHLLANKPTEFRSGSRFGLINRIIYHCTFVNQLTVDPEKTSNFHCPTPQTENKRPSTTYPENYLVCVHFYDLFRGLFQSLCCWRSIAEIKTDAESQGAESQVPVRQRNHVFPPNYDVIIGFFKLVPKAIFIRNRKFQLMREKKEKHVWSVQIMEKLLENYSYYQYEQDAQESVIEHSNKDGGTAPCVFDPELLLDGSLPDASPSGLGENESSSSKRTRTGEKKLEGAISNKGETPILTAAKNGITEMVESILKKFPVAINDMNDDKKNIVLLAVEHGQVEVYNLLLAFFKDNDRVFQKVDSEGNSALHIAASGRHIQGLAPGAALQLHERYMWYEFVKRSKTRGFFPKYNKYWKTALEVLNETNKNRIDDANKWMSDASQSCSVVAVLVATIAYTTSATIPGGFKGGDSGGRDSGLPVLGGHAMFDVFSISGDVAFVLSTMALVLFLPVFSSYNQVSHFRTAAPAKLLVGLTLLLLSLTAIMVSFSAAESFIVVNGNRKFMKFIIFAATCFPIILVANQFPLYFRIFKSVVQNAFA